MTAETTGGDLSRLRHLNALTAIRVLRADEAGFTLTELARRTGLSRASTEDVVRDLTERGWVAEAEKTAGGVGRPARRYRFRADAGHLLGVDIGRHRVLALLTDLDGKVLHSHRVEAAPGLGRIERLAATDDAVRGVLRAGALSGDRLWASGVATTGLVDGTGKVMLSEALHEWTGVDLAAHLGRLVTGPVLVENDSKLAALAESWQGVARHSRDVVFILSGVATGAGLIIDGKLHRGFGNAAGEIGALPAVGWTRAPEHLRDWPGEGDIFAAARDGDRRAVAAIKRYVKDLAVGVSALVLTLDPELVVVGGGFAGSADLLIGPLRAELDRWCIRTPEIRVSTLADRGVALGAVKLAADHVGTVLASGSGLTSIDQFARA
ncbi:ROK family transcriptional regulator [Winogradskya consettensis]|uniref:Transcriptional regulator n=1 Tax=Winogradskya consettensis TaxID=113560 RepID=A0A919VIB0_9ACTN|nr:ROK family protein [Actinoplanes consettensis]GIM66808.1 transcriptional regulator [Actinoplanes consettensis]